MRKEGFAEKVKDWWLMFKVEVHASFLFTTKLKMLKEHLKEWKKETISNLKLEKEALLVNLHDLDEKEVERKLQENLRVRKSCIKKELADVCRLQKIAWRQRSKELWLKEEDKNTAFFDRSACVHRSFNYLMRIVGEGNMIENLYVMREQICTFYKKTIH